MAGSGPWAARRVSDVFWLRFQPVDTTHSSSADIDAADFHKFIYETSRPQICSRPQLHQFFESEAGFVEAHYRAKDGATITTVRFDKSDCE